MYVMIRRVKTDIKGGIETINGLIINKKLNIEKFVDQNKSVPKRSNQR